MKLQACFKPSCPFSFSGHRAPSKVSHEHCLMEVPFIKWKSPCPFKNIKLQACSSHHAPSLLWMVCLASKLYRNKFVKKSLWIILFNQAQELFGLFVHCYDNHTRLLLWWHSGNDIEEHCKVLCSVTPRLYEAVA